MKYYVATHSSNLDKAREAMAYVRSQGHEITCDWTNQVESQKKGILKMSSLQICHQDIYGVLDAAAVIYLHTEERSTGAWFEMGLAVGRGIPVAAIVGQMDDAERVNLFWRFLFLNCNSFPTVDHSRFFIYETIEDYFAAVRRQGEERRARLGL